jgi:hypothetical protein
MPVDIAAALKKELEEKGVVEDTLKVATALDVPHFDVVGASNSLFAKE